LKWNENFELLLKEKEDRKIGSQQINTKENISQKKSSETIPCPKCSKGKVLKGKTAYGCSNWQAGCDWRFSFDEVREKANGKSLTKNLVTKILQGKI